MLAIIPYQTTQPALCYNSLDNPLNYYNTALQRLIYMMLRNESAYITELVDIAVDDFMDDPDDTSFAYEQCFTDIWGFYAENYNELEPLLDTIVRPHLPGDKEWTIKAVDVLSTGLAIHIEEEEETVCLQ